MSTKRPIPFRPVPYRELAPPAELIVRSAYARFIVAAGAPQAVGKSAEEFARTRWPDDEAVPYILATGPEAKAALERREVQRAAIAPGMTGTAGWGAEVAVEAVPAFLASLNADSAAAALIPLGIGVSFNGNASVRIPARSTGPAALQFVKEGDPIPVKQFSLTDAINMDPYKIASISVFSRELAKRAEGEAVITGALREDAAISLDTAYFSTAAAVSGESPAGLLYGVTPSTGYGGGDYQAIVTDLAAITTAVATAGSGQVVYVTGPARKQKLQMLMPDLKPPVLSSLAVPEDRIIAIDPRSLAHGFGPEPDIMASQYALLHMSDDPLPISASGVADPVRSTYQTATVAVRLILDIAFGKRRSGAVAYVDGVTW